MADAPEIPRVDKAEYVAQKLLKRWRQEEATMFNEEFDEEKEEAAVELNELLTNYKSASKPYSRRI